MTPEDYEKIGMTPSGRILWHDWREMIDYNVQYHKHTTEYQKLVWEKIGGGPANGYGIYTTLLDVHAHLYIRVIVRPYSVRIGIISDTIGEMYCITHYT